MAGNVLEWCRDRFGPYSDQTVSDPLGPTTVDLRVLRGGSFDYTEFGLRAAGRNGLFPDFRGDNVGFRLVSSRLRP